jgi:hypothetical protein
VQTPGLIVVLYEDLSYRQIFLDGRELPKDPNPAWMGYSVGHWDGDTLVVESTGYNDRTWLDAGYPHTENMRVTERIRRSDFGHLAIEISFSDPAFYEKHGPKNGRASTRPIRSLSSTSARKTRRIECTWWARTPMISRTG